MPEIDSAQTDERAEVGTLQEVLAALSDPVRLEMVQRMYAGAARRRARSCTTASASRRPATTSRSCVRPA